MSIGQFFRDRFVVIRALVAFQKTVWYPILFAVLCIISGTHDKSVYIPIILVLCSFVAFSVLFTDDNKVFLVPLLMIYYSLGFDNSNVNSYGNSNGDVYAIFDPGALKIIFLCAAVTVGMFVLRLFYDGSVALAFKKKSILTYSIFGLDLALILNGAFRSGGDDSKDLVYGLLIALGLTSVYFLVRGMLARSKNILPYACKAAVCTAYAALGQTLVLIARAASEGKYLNDSMEICRSVLTLSWGLPTMTAALIVLGIPAAFYLAKNCKCAPLSYFSAIAFVIGAILVNTRSAIIVGFLIFAICNIEALTTKKNRRTLIACTAVISTIILAFIAYVAITRGDLIGIVKDTLSHMRFDEELWSGSGRVSLWKNGLGDFVSSPVFGAGFTNGGYENPNQINVFANMYHCIVIEFLGSAGIFGALAFLFHVISLGITMFKQFSVNKFLILMLPAMIIGMSFADNFFFYLNFQIFYGVFLVIAELEPSECEDADASAITKSPD